MATASFQSTVRREQTTGFLGEVIEDGPSRAFPGIVTATSPALNTFGNVYTHVSGSDGSVEVGGSGAFAGFLTSPKQNVTSGDASGALDPTLVLRNNETGQILDMGIIIINQVDAGGASIGDALFYDPSNNLATSGTVSVVSAGVFTATVPNAKVVRHNTSGAGLIFIQLTN